MWKEFNKYKITSESVTEEIILEQSENMFRVRNEFGNMSIEFDLTTGLVFAKSLLEDMNHIAENEVKQFMNKSDIEDDVIFDNQANDFGAD